MRPALPRVVYRLLQPVRRLYCRIVRPRTFGVVVLIRNGTDVLLIRHSYGRTRPWTVPGGGFNPNRETPEQAGRREICEELGLSLDAITLIGQYDSTAEYKRDTVFCLIAETATRAVIPSGEIEAFQWVDRNERPVNLSAAARKSFEFAREKSM